MMERIYDIDPNEPHDPREPIDGCGLIIALVVIIGIVAYVISKVI